MSLSSQTILDELGIDQWVLRQPLSCDTRQMVLLHNVTGGGLVIISDEAYAQWYSVKYLLKNILRYLKIVTGMEFAILRPATDGDHQAQDLVWLIETLKPKYLVSFGQNSLPKQLPILSIVTVDLVDLFADGLLKAEVLKDVRKLGV